MKNNQQFNEITQLKEVTRLEDVIKNISTVINKLDQMINRGEEYTIIIGPTGAGKSTIANVLIGNEIVRKNVGGKFVYDVKENSPIKIGHANQSQTEWPNIYKTYIDCPGFEDTTPQRELQNAFYIDKMFNITAQHKIIIVIEASSIFDGRCKRFINLVKKINEGVGNNFIKFSQHFGLCITKFSSDDYSQDIINNPDKIYKIIKKELIGSPKKELAELFKSLKGKICLFMKNDSYSSVKNNLNELLIKILPGKIKIKSKISPEGDMQINLLIKQIFSQIISFNEKVVQEYLDNFKADLKINFKTEFTILKKKLKMHNVYSKKDLLNLLISNIKQIEEAANMKQLIESLKEFNNKGVVVLSENRLEAVEFISSLYPDADIIAKDYGLKIAKVIYPLINYEDKIVKFNNDIEQMDKYWDFLKLVTTTSEVAKAVIITCGVGTTLGLALLTSGAAFVVVGGVMIVAATAGGGGLTAVASAAITATAAKSCNAWDKDHPTVAPILTLFKEL